MNDKIKLLILDVDGTLTDGGVYVNEDGSEFRKFNAKDGMGIKRARQLGFEVGIISHSHLPGLIGHRAKVLGIPWVYAGNEPKLAILDGWLQKNGWHLDQVAFIGDDINDLELIDRVGLSACPQDAVDEVKNQVDHVLTRHGGDGAVREFIDRFLIP
ncbi:MAG: HAD-IIIA family hydrolase [Bacteroidota bacterium]